MIEVDICGGANHVCGAQPVDKPINNGKPLPDIGGSFSGNSPGVIVDLSGAYRPPQIDKNVNSNAYGMKVYAQHVRGLDNFARRGDWGQFNSAANKIFPTDGHKVVGVMDMILNGMHGAAHGLTKLLSPFGKVLASDALMYEKQNFPGQHHGAIDNIVENIINSYPDDGQRIGAILEAVPHGFLKTAERLIDNLQTTHSKVHAMQSLNDSGSAWMADYIAARLPNDMARVDGIVEAAKAGYNDAAFALFDRISSSFSKVHAMEEMHNTGRVWIANTMAKKFPHDSARMAALSDAVRAGYTRTADTLFEFTPSNFAKIHEMELRHNANEVWIANTIAKKFPHDSARTVALSDAVRAGYTHTADTLFEFTSSNFAKIHEMELRHNANEIWIANTMAAKFPHDMAKIGGIEDAVKAGYTRTASTLLNSLSNPTIKITALQNAASQGKTNVAQFLVDTGKIDINGRMNGQANPEGTPLYKAIQANQPEMAKWFVAKGGMVVDVLHGAGAGTWKFAVDTVKGLYELGNLAGEALANSPNNLKIVTSAIEREIAEAKVNPDKKLNEVSQGLANLYTKLGHFPDTNKLAKSLSDWLETTPLDAQVAQATYAGLEVATFGVGTIGKKFPRIVKESTDIASTKTSLFANEATNIANYARLKLDLRTIQSANHVVDSLKATGKLPNNYVTKDMAYQKGWIEGKAVNNYIPGGQIGGDIFDNSPKILPDSPGRIWYEADVGLSNTMARGNAAQPGSRILYSSDGLVYITTDHYKTVVNIGKWR